MKLKLTLLSAYYLCFGLLSLGIINRNRHIFSCCSLQNANTQLLTAIVSALLPRYCRHIKAVFFNQNRMSASFPSSTFKGILYQPTETVEAVYYVIR